MENNKVHEEIKLLGWRGVSFPQFPVQNVSRPIWMDVIYDIYIVRDAHYIRSLLLKDMDGVG